MGKPADDPWGLREQGFNSFGQPTICQAYAGVAGAFFPGMETLVITAWG